MFVVRNLVDVLYKKWVAEFRAGLFRSARKSLGGQLLVVPDVRDGSECLFPFFELVAIPFT